MSRDTVIRELRGMLQDGEWPVEVIERAYDAGAQAERATLVEGLLDLLDQMESFVASEDEFDVMRTKVFDYANSPPGLRFVIDAVLARERAKQ